MRAWQVRTLGRPADVMSLDHDVAEPEVPAGHVVIDVTACALNFADSLLCDGTYQEHPPRPFTPGLEVAGVVARAAPGSPHRVGDRVAGSPSLPSGGLADRCLARDLDVFAVPDQVSDRIAAAMHVAYQTGWFALHRRAHLDVGETLLVHAGAGGVGSAAIQLGRAAGATVIATAGGPDKVARCLALGAHHALDYRVDDIVDPVNDLTGGRGADVVFDPVNGQTFTRSTKCIAWEGRIVVIGAAGGGYVEARTNHALVKNYSVVGLNWRSYLVRRPDLVAQAHRALMDLTMAGTIDPLIGDVIALDADVPAALDAITSGRTVGKTVVEP